MIAGLYRLATATMEPLVPLLLERRLRRGKEDPCRLDERLGRSRTSRPEGSLVWVHAASVGESLSVLPLVERIALHASTSVLITTMTTTAAAVLAPRLPQRCLHQYAPLDVPGAVTRFLDRWRPDAALWVESELWPNLLSETRRRQVPTALVNGRMSELSFARWRRLPSFGRTMIGGFVTVLVGSETDGARFSSLGAARVEVIGDLKATAGPLEVEPDALARLKDRIGDRRVWLAVSTHEGDERLAGEVHRKAAEAVAGILTVIVPRHPPRADAIEADLAGRGFRVARRSRGDLPDRDTDIFLGDSLGEMGLYLRLGRPVFIGKSMLHEGGHNPREAAMLGNAVVFGPHMENFTDIARRLVEAGGAFEACDAGELVAHITRLLLDDDACRLMGECATALAQSDATGVLDRVCEALQPLLEVTR